MTNLGKRSLALLLVSVFVIAVLGLVAVPGAQSQDETPPPATKTFKLEIRFAKKDLLEKESKQNLDLDGKLVITLDFGGQK
ncbi:MAG: hypothetical protein RDV41_12640, partial [Planctomycetota bacterium]|nr:hypothetical protein [Planctomycetota bacterium]